MRLFFPQVEIIEFETAGDFLLSVKDDLKDSLLITERRLPLFDPRPDMKERLEDIYAKFPESQEWDSKISGDIITTCLRAKNISIQI